MFYLLYGLGIVSIITGGIKLLNKKFTPEEVSDQKLLAILALTDIGLTLAKEATKYINTLVTINLVYIARIMINTTVLTEIARSMSYSRDLRNMC